MASSLRGLGLIIGGEIREGFDCIVISQEWCLRAFFQALPRAAPLPPLPYVCAGVLMVFHHFFLCSSLLMPIHSPSTCPLPTFLSCHPNPSSFFFPCSYLLHLFSLLLCLALLPPTTSTSPSYLSFFPLPSPSWPFARLPLLPGSALSSASGARFVFQAGGLYLSFLAH